jgi:hypothetical protein
VAAECGLGQIASLRRLNAAGVQAADATAERVAALVDELLDKPWSRRGEAAREPAAPPEPQTAVEATCSCGSGIPVQTLEIDGQPVTLVALPLIFAQLREAGKAPGAGTARELLETVKIYNTVLAGAESSYGAALLREYTAFCAREEVHA